MGAKTFVQLKDGTWIESGLAGKGKDKTKKLAGATEVVYLSKAYFALLKQHPGIGRYLKVGKKLTFEFKGVIYRIAPEVEKPKGGKKRGRATRDSGTNPQPVIDSVPFSHTLCRMLPETFQPETQP